jgi:hypothetical protein
MRTTFKSLIKTIDFYDDMKNASSRIMNQISFFLHTRMKMRIIDHLSDIILSLYTYENVYHWLFIKYHSSYMYENSSSLIISQINVVRFI